MSTCIHIRTQHCNSVIKVNTRTIVQRVLENDPVWYVADATEGNTLTFDGSTTGLINGVETDIDLRGKTVTAVNRENYELKPTLLTDPENKEFNWNRTTAVLTLRNDLDEGEQIKIKYR